MDRQRVMRSAGPWRYVGCHRLSQFELPIGCRGEQCDNQVFQSDHAYVELFQLGVSHVGKGRFILA
jgi:hypothetical protein